VKLGRDVVDNVLETVDETVVVIGELNVVEGVVRVTDVDELLVVAVC
jgi:hypothetical protein